jgi:hypothetical protein
MGWILRICNIFSAKNAVNKDIFPRINPITEKVARQESLISLQSIITLGAFQLRRALPWQASGFAALN